MRRHISSWHCAAILRCQCYLRDPVVLWLMHRSAELMMQDLSLSQTGTLEAVSWSLWEALRIWPQRPCFHPVSPAWLCGGRQSLPSESMRRRRQITKLSSIKVPAMSHGAANTWLKTLRRVLPWIGQGISRSETWWTAKPPLCPSMQGTPCVESFVTDDTWDVGCIYERSHSMWTAGNSWEAVELHGCILCSSSAKSLDDLTTLATFALLDMS